MAVRTNHSHRSVWGGPVLVKLINVVLLIIVGFHWLFHLLLMLPKTSSVFCHSLWLGCSLFRACCKKNIIVIQSERMSILKFNCSLVTLFSFNDAFLVYAVCFVLTSTIHSLLALLMQNKYFYIMLHNSRLPMVYSPLAYFVTDNGECSILFSGLFVYNFYTWPIPFMKDGHE